MSKLNVFGLFSPRPCTRPNAISCAMNLCPVFTPTLAEFSDFRGYLEKVEPTLREVGLCKVCPDSNTTSKFAVEFSLFVSGDPAGRVGATFSLRPCPRCY